MSDLDVWIEVEDTITIRSSNGRPFTIRGYYSIGSNDIFATYMGTTMDYPLNSFHNASGYIDIYCYSGSITLYFFHSPYSGEPWSMSFDICFPEIYNVRASRTNSNYTHIASQGGNNSKTIIYHSLDEGQQFVGEQPLYYNPDSIYYNIAAGKKYVYYITDSYNYDTTDHCQVPRHYFRTPKQNDCNTCEHYKNCVEYTKFTGSKLVTCYKGSTYLPDSTECVVDDGPSSSTSQHTVHTDVTAFDPNTNNQLRTIPIGDTASVRLGNWNTGKGGESILYEIHVDTNDYDLMMLRYAVVFLDPEVEGDQQPRFSIRLTDENCNPIDPLCYSRDIFPKRNAAGWNVRSVSNGHSYVWHDWWTMGINLSSYHGKVIYLQLYTYDGTADGAAYAYFTLHCARKQIDHLQNCGDAVANTFYAPEGFNYRWFNVDSSNVTLSTQRMLNVTDSGLYQCLVTPIDCPSNDCGYYINALSSPRYPHARFEHVDSIGTCMFKVRFVNRSYISAGANDTVPLWTNEDCETAYWDFGNGETSTNYNAETIYRAAGTYNVKLITTIAGGQCADTIIIPIVLQWTHPAPYISGLNALCPGSITQLTIHNTQSQKWLLPNTSHPPQSESVNLTPLLTQHSFTVDCSITDDNGCKDTLHYPIHIYNQYNETDTRVICQAQLEGGWNWRGHTFYEGTTTGEIYYQDTTIHGCDSNVTLNLVVHETYHRYHTYVFCDYATSFPYPPNAANPLIVYDSAGMYDYTFHTAQNCDSIIHLTMRKHVVDHDTIRDNVCRGYAYDTLDFHFSATQNSELGTQVITHTVTERLSEIDQVQSCDSTMTVILTVNPQTSSSRSYVRNQNQLPFTFNGVDFYGNVDTIFHLTNQYGCDSSVHLVLAVNFNTETHYYDTICQNQLPYTWDGITFDSAMTHRIPLTRANGADSSIYRHLTVHPTYDDNVFDTICDNATITFCGVTYSHAGSYTHTLATIEGCDSITQLMLTVNPTHTSEYYDTTCDNQQYSFGGQVRDTEGDHTHVFLNSYSCDSTVTLHLHISNVTYSTVAEVLVQNDLPHTFNGVTYTMTQMEQYRDSHHGAPYCDTITIVNDAGCDSTIYHTLTINWNQHTTVYQTICDNQFPVDWDGTLFAAGDYTMGDTVIVKEVTLTNADQADSIVSRRLHVNPTYTTTFSDTICDNATYSYNGSIYTATGSYTNMLQSIAACDSMVTLLLTVNAVTYSDLYDTIVENQMPYTLNGVTYQIAETETIAPRMNHVRDTATITNVKGCDSIIDLRLYVHINVYDTVDSTICANLLPMQWNARIFGNYVIGTRDYELNDTLTAWTGADSILTMRLHVDPTYDQHYYDTICSNQQVTFHNATYNMPGTYQHPLTSSLQCDSLETLHLTVFGTSAAIISDTIVENQLRQGYSFNGVMFDPLLFDATTYITPRFSQLDSTIVVTNQTGCDSTIHYTLNVHWNVNAVTDSTLCENNLPLHWNHRTFAGYEAGIVDYEMLDTLVAHTGADSMLTMRLHVDTNSSSHIPDTVLENALPHTFNGVTYTLGQMEALREVAAENPLGTLLLDTITIANGRSCDSVIHHALYIRWNKTTHIADTICENYFPYSWQGRTIAADSTQLAIYNQPFTLIDTIVYASAGGEDSLVVMHLHVKRNSISTLYDTIVENQLDYLWNGITFTWDDTTGVDLRHADLQHTGIIANAAGCDSIAAMNLMVWLNRIANADSNVCENYFPFTWNGAAFDTTGSQSVMIETTHGADSLLTMTVTELFNSTSAAADTIVENQLAYTFNNALFDHSHFGDTSLLHIPPSSMTYIDTTVIITNDAGCDSIISYRLNVWWNVINGTDDTLCSQMLPHQWNSRVFTQDIADSSIMEGRWRVATLYDTLPAWSGADSLLAMHLHVMPSFYIDFNDTVCSSSYIAWYGDTLYETGVYPMAFQTMDGCDSIEYLHFANYPNYDFEYFDTICDYSGVMRIGVEYLGVAHLPTMHGCDSNEVYHLWGMPVSYSSVDTIISERQIPFGYNGEWFADSGTTQQQFILTNQYGCDSIINFTITVMPTVRQTLDSSICDGAMPLEWDGTVFNYVAGIADYELIDTLAGAYGADSIVTRRVHVSPSYDINYVDTTCNGAPYLFGDSSYSVSGIYYHQYLTTGYDPIWGIACDSLETLDLHVNAMSYATVHDTIVENQLPYTFGGVTFTTTDEIVDSTIIILNTVACDSVITYSLHVYPNSYVDLDTVVCDDELPFYWDGRQVTHGGMDSIVLPKPDGTDSVTRYRTVVNPTYNQTDTVRICDSYEWIDGNTYTESAVVEGLTLTSVDGCDSIKNLRLTIDHQTTTHDSITSCDPYVWIDSLTYSASISGPTHLLQTVHGCDSTVVLEFTKVEHKVTELYDTICRGVRYQFGGNEYSESGVYSDSLNTATGCDSVVEMHLHVLEPPTVSITWEHDCETKTYTITGHSDVPWFEWSSFPEDPTLAGQEHRRTIQVIPTTHTTYLFTADYKDVPTCPSDTTVNLSPLLLPHALIEYTPEFLTYDQLHLSAISRSTNEETLRWYVNDNDMGDHERIGYTADPRNDDSVVVMLTAHNGICHDTDLVVIPFRKASIWAPNAFTPEKDDNNRFFVRHTGITDYRIDLYTRGGVLVWHSEDMYDSWDGTYKGKPCPQETYVWIIRYRDVTAPKNLLSKKGTVTLIR